MGVLYYKERYTLMANAPEDLSALKRAYPESGQTLNKSNISQ